MRKILKDSLVVKLMGLPSFFKSSSKTLFFVFTIGFIMFPSLGEAQCAMCRAVLESEASGNTAEGVNNGIVYLMAIPYVLVAGIFYFIYRKMRS